MPLLHLDSLATRTGKSAIIKWLEHTGGLDPNRIGRIELEGRRATIEIPVGWEARLVRALDGTRLDDRRVRAWSSGAAAANPDSHEHFERMRKLLDLEAKAEAAQLLERAKRLNPEDAERTGNTLIDLVISDEFSGLGGRVILTLTKGKRQTRLPWTRLDVGTPVMLSAGRAAKAVLTRGVICEKAEGFLRVAVNFLADEAQEHSNWRLDLAQDEVAGQRQRAALERARAASGDRLASLRDILTGHGEPDFAEVVPLKVMNPRINESQTDAIQLALSARDMALIHGPPGTGKTTAVVELIRQAVARGERVLACAPSNMAVDNLMERLVAAGERPVRIGHPARVLPQLRERTLDLLVGSHPDVRVARKLVDEAFQLRRQADRYTRAKPEPGAKREMRAEARDLLAAARRLEQQVADSILDGARILCATTTGLDSDLIGPRRYDLAVIDEACQSTEPGCWIPILRADRVVLAGDHCQLPPTVISAEAIDQGFSKSLFERLLELHGPRVNRRLELQYRMHQSIMEFSSREFYDAALEADPSVASHLLEHLPRVIAGPLTSVPMEFIDTAGAGFDEELEPDGDSRRNPREAQLVALKIAALVEAGIPARDIGVITPYAAQVRLLRERIELEGLEIDSVDGFQGREKEAIIISFVRSNPRGEIGFLSDVRRTNVALTRARRKLLAIGDSATLGSHPFYRRLLEYFEGLGAYRTVWEEEGLEL